MLTPPQQRPPWRLAALISIAVLAVLAAAAGAQADPSIDEKRSQAEAILAEINSLGAEVGMAAERFNGANYELSELTTKLAETREDLTHAKKLQTTAQAWIAKRLRSLYINGDKDGGALEVLLGAQSLDDLLTRIDLAERVSAQDARIASEVKALRERVAKRKKQLVSMRARQALVVRQRAAEKQAIEAKLAERERLLGSVREEIARLEEAERRRQAELRRQAAIELERQRLVAAEQRAAAQAAARQPLGVGSGSSNQPASSTSYVAPPADASRGAQVVAIAMQYLGTPYVWAASDPSVGFDCSGLTKYVFAQVGVSLPHYAAAQYQMGVPVSRDQLQPGDLVFFSGLGHMGMYIGGGNMIHAPQTGDVVKISSINDPYRIAGWVGARRVL